MRKKFVLIKSVTWYNLPYMQKYIKFHSIAIIIQTSRKYKKKDFTAFLQWSKPYGQSTFKKKFNILHFRLHDIILCSGFSSVNFIFSTSVETDIQLLLIEKANTHLYYLKTKKKYDCSVFVVFEELKLNASEKYALHLKFLSRF